MRQGLQHLNVKGKDQGVLRFLSQNFPVDDFLRDIIGISEWTQQGDEYIHQCVLPFGLHKGSDSNPSASFNSKLMCMNCFVCGGGSIIWWIQQVKGCDENAALQNLRSWMSGKGGGGSGGKATFKVLQEVLGGNGTLRATVYPSYSEKILTPWIGVHEYFTERGVTSEVQISMKTGFDPLDHRVVIPIFFKGKMVGWSKRRIAEDDKSSKYKHSVGLPKSTILYNWDNVQEEREVYVVESPFSTLKLLSEGVSSVATMGAQVTELQMQLLRKFPKVVVVGDGDLAGYKMNNQVVDFLRKDTTVEVVLMPQGEDPGSLENAGQYIKDERIPAVIWMTGIS